MKRNILFFGVWFLGCFFNILSAQVPEATPAQRYRMDVRLDPGTQQLHNRMQLDYTNTSGDTLSSLVIHLWANAFSTPWSAYGRQKLQFGDTRFYFASNQTRVRYSTLTVRAEEQPLEMAPWRTEADIAVVNLPVPLAPGAATTLAFDYTLDIPGFHSRMGTDGEIWQLAHWFPKVARYDREGWHPLPYLEMGEFYQDFADYAVRITLPDSMLVVATGMPGDAGSEQHRLAALARSASGQPGMAAAEGGQRTWTFVARWVPDFAWAASAAYLLESETFPLADGREVLGQVVFTPERRKAWAGSLKAVRLSTQHYDRLVGGYPWPQVTAIQGVRGFPGGMEYPMVTFIQPSAAGSALETVIAHEIGHNWFYGVLSSDERRYPWMDEGLNSYYEYRYTRERGLDEGLARLGIDAMDYLLMDRAGARTLPLPADGVSRLGSEIDYQLSAYTIPSHAFRLLAEVVGEEAIDRAFQAYYREWRFRHPAPGDVRAAFEASLGQDLSWLFEDAMGKPWYRDIRLKEVRPADGALELKVANKYQTRLPWRVEQWGGDQLLSSQWMAGFEGRDTLVRVPLMAGLTHVRLLDTLVPDLRLGNNSKWLSGLPRYRDWSPGFAYGVRHARQPRTYVLPLLGYNLHDGWMPGLALHNQKVYYQPAGYYLAGFYGVASGEWLYQGALYHDIYPGGGPGQWRMALRAASFSHFHNEEKDFSLRYHRLAPSLEWQSREGQLSGEAHWKGGLYAWFVQRERYRDAAVRPGDWERIFAGRMRRDRPDALQPWHTAIDVEFQAYQDPFGGKQAYLKTGWETQLGFRLRPRSQFNARVFLGYFPYNTARRSGSVSSDLARGSLALAFQGHNDYRFEQTFMGRNQADHGYGRQIAMREGGFKTALGAAVAEGQSNDMVLALNLWSGLPIDLPAWLPVQCYADLGYFADRRPISRDLALSDQIWVDAGLKLAFWEDRMAIYVPLYQNIPLGELINQHTTRFWQRVSWSARFDLVRLPWRPQRLL